MLSKSIASLNLMVKSADAAAGRLWEILDTPLEIKDAQNAIALDKSKVQGHLSFEKVRFAYGDGPDVLHSIDFEVKPGEVVALAGLSGSGKSTIAALLPRLYDPTGGRITLDGVDLRDIKVQSLRDLIGAVPQDVTLFHGTVRDNIAYGSPGAELNDVVAAARRAHADVFIRKLPEGYDAPIGERGGGFSGGQKQRLAIARALLRDPKLLILDEATSALDAESEGLVQDALTELMKGRTTLIIAHRFSTIIHADRILVLDQGRIIESGNHAQLLAQKGQYFRLYQMQSFQARRGDDALPEGSTPEPGETAALGAA
jgi:subfamily B ATP-binding cassette protein MsbA